MSINLKNVNYMLFVVILVDFLFLFYGISTISISSKEAYIFFDAHNFLHYLVLFFTKVFSQNDFVLRLPFIIFHILSIFLLYKISAFYLKEEKERLLVVILFILLPGVVSSALIVNESSIVVFFSLLFIYLFKNEKFKLYYPLLFILLFVDNAFEILYLGVFAYAVYKNRKNLAFYSAFLFILILFMYGFDSGGKPKGYFLDTLAMYSLVFSPLLFLYYFYTMYRILFKGKKDILWFVSFTALILSILLSFRQRISISDFAPFAVIALPLVVKNFIDSYKVRLKEYRKFYKIAFFATFVFLVLNFLLTYFNKYLYLFLNDPNKHFARKFHIAKELAQKLKQNHIDHIVCENKSLCKRLYFYKISKGDEYFLSKFQKVNGLKKCKKVTISYNNRAIASYCVSKLHTLE